MIPQNLLTNINTKSWRFVGMDNIYIVANKRKTKTGKQYCHYELCSMWEDGYDNIQFTPLPKKLYSRLSISKRKQSIVKKLIANNAVIPAMTLHYKKLYYIFN